MSKIILSGYMASGKTTIALLLSKAMGIKYYDLDDIIEKTEGKTITEIFSGKGEIYFRKLEHESLKRIMDTADSFILSLGGGTPCYFNNHEILKRADVLSVYLNVSVNVLTERLLLEKSKRPLLQNLTKEELQEFVAKHLFERSYFYNQSKKVIITEGKTPEDIVNEIISFY